MTGVLSFWLLAFFCWLFLFAFWVVFSRQPFVSVICLILTFFFVAVVLFLVNAEFLALSILLIYVGGIAVVFVFLIVLLDLKGLGRDRFLLISLIVAISLIFFFYFFYFRCKHALNLSVWNIPEGYIVNTFWENLYASRNIAVLGFNVYTFYVIHVIVLGLILFVAIITAIFCFTKIDGVIINGLRRQDASIAYNRRRARAVMLLFDKKLFD